jgi:hypothetical protein
MGDYGFARKRCQDLQDKFIDPKVAQSQQLKKYETLCLRMQVELDAHELPAARITME